MQREPDLFEQTWSKPFALSSHHCHTHGASDESPDDFDGYDVMPMGPVPSQSASAASSAVQPAAIGRDRHDFVPFALTRRGAASIGRKKRPVECLDPYSAEVLCVFDSQRAAARHLCISQSAPSRRFQDGTLSCGQCAHSYAGKSSSVVRLRRLVGGANAVAS